jgi:opacity protein-like surface antigen
MKKFFALLTAIAALTTFSSQAHAEGDFYVGALGAGNWISAGRFHCTRQSYSGGYAVAGFLGYRWCEGWRIEGEGSYRHNNLHRIKFDFGSSCDSCYDSFREETFCKKPILKQWAAMVNVLYEMDPCEWNYFCCCIPYCGVGLGYANQKIHFNELFNHEHGQRSEFDSLSRNESGFAWQVMVGIAYRITESVDVSVEYRMLNGQIEKLYNHAFGVTAKWYFF